MSPSQRPWQHAGPSWGSWPEVGAQQMRAVILKSTGSGAACQGECWADFPQCIQAAVSLLAQEPWDGSLPTWKQRSRPLSEPQPRAQGFSQSTSVLLAPWSNGTHHPILQSLGEVKGFTQGPVGPMAELQPKQLSTGQEERSE